MYSGQITIRSFQYMFLNIMYIEIRTNFLSMNSDEEVL